MQTRFTSRTLEMQTVHKMQMVVLGRRHQVPGPGPCAGLLLSGLQSCGGCAQTCAGARAYAPPRRC